MELTGVTQVPDGVALCWRREFEVGGPRVRNEDPRVEPPNGDERWRRFRAKLRVAGGEGHGHRPLHGTGGSILGHPLSFAIECQKKVLGLQVAELPQRAKLPRPVTVATEGAKKLARLSKEPDFTGSGIGEHDGSVT